MDKSSGSAPAHSPFVVQKSVEVGVYMVLWMVVSGLAGSSGPGKESLEEEGQRSQGKRLVVGPTGHKGGRSLYHMITPSSCRRVTNIYYSTI